jgi:hypothetical protein
MISTRRAKPGPAGWRCSSDTRSDMRKPRLSRGCGTAVSGKTLVLCGMKCSDRLAAGGLRKLPAGGEENRRLFICSARTGTSAGADSGLRKSIRINRQNPLLFPYAVTLRRSHDACINQRIDSLPCPALFLNVSGAASPFFRRARISPNNNDRPAQPRTTVGLCGNGLGVAREESGMWLNLGGIEVREGL